MKKLARRKKRRRLSTSRELTDRKSLTSTLPSLTRMVVVVEAEAADVVVAVDVVEIAVKVESTVSVARGQRENTVSVVNPVSALREKAESVLNVASAVHQGKREMLLPAVEEIAEAVVDVVVTAEAVDVVAVASRNLTWTKRLSLPWDRSTKIDIAASVRT